MADTTERVRIVVNVEKAELDEFTTAIGKANTAAGGAVKGLTQLERAAVRAGDAQGKNAQQTKKGTESIISQRYALYDLATTYGIVSTAILAAVGYATVLGAQFERSFTNVERTLDSTTVDVGALRDELVDLSTQIPLTFDEITKIATLGNQLGVAAEDISGFTETVAQFSAITGVSVEQTAQAFGGLGNILNISAAEYSNLASAIALAGRRGVTTEAEILSLSKEIAQQATQAGFAADSTIGLAVALGNLRLPPERSRGALTTYFQTLNLAVAQGGEKLQDFATVVGVTAAELENMVRSGQGEEVFRRFLASFQNLDSVDATAALDRLGLAQLRVSDVFQRLSGNIDTFNSSMNDAEQGWSENAELARQYGLIIDDLSSQWEVFINSINALITELTSGGVKGLAGLLAAITGVVNGFREFAENNSWIAQVARIALGIAAVVGVLVAMRAASLLATASTYAFATAQATLSGSVTGIRGLIATLIPGLVTYTTTAEGATVATYSWAKAFRALASATIVLALIGAVIQVLTDFDGTVRGITPVLVWFADTFQQQFAVVGAVIGVLGQFIQRLGQMLGPLGSVISLLGTFVSVFGAVTGQINGTNIQKGQNALLGIEKNAGKLNKTAADGVGALGDYAGGLGDVGNGAAGAAKEVRTLVDYANDLQSTLSRAFDIQFGAQTAFDEITSAWQAINDEMDEYRRKVQELTADKAVQQYFLSVANQFGDGLRAGVLTSNIADLNAEIADAQAKSSTQLNGNSKAAINNRKRLAALSQEYQDYIVALAASGADQATLNAALLQSEAAFKQQALALGFSNAQIQPYIQSFRNMAVVIATVPRNITVQANVNPAIQALNELAARAKTTGASGGAALASGYKSGLNSVNAAIDVTEQKLQKLSGKGVPKVSGKSKITIESGFASGGYTGSGGKYQPKGVVHGGEFVFTKEATKNIGVGNLYSMMRGAQQGRGYASGGAVGRTVVTSSGGAIYGMVDLSPATISNLARAVAPQVVVNMDPVQVARSANKGNQQLQARGSR